MTALIDPYRFVVVETDPYWSNVVLMMRTNGSLTELTGVATTFAQTGDGTVEAITPPSGLYATSYRQPNSTTAESHAVHGRSEIDDTLNPYHFPVGTDFTLELWMRPTQLASNMGVLAGNHNYPNAGSFTIQMGTTGAIGITFGSGPTFIFSTTGIIAIDNWYHVAVTRSSTTVRVFVNGVQVASGTYNGVLNAAQTFNIISVGKGIAADNPSFKGYIQEARITKGVARYTAGFSVPTAPFPTS